MPSFLSKQSSYGRPAEAPLIRRDIELEGTNLAFKDILPKKAEYFADSLGGINSEFLSVDKPIYDQYKAEITKKAEELRGRMESGEDVKKIIPEMSAFKNQASSALNLFKQRKDLYSQWDQDLSKQVQDGKIDGNTADEYRQLAMANIAGYTAKSGLGVDLPLPTAGPKVNYHEEAAKFVKEQVAREGDEWYEKAWNQLPVDETKYENTKRGYELSRPEKIAYIVKKNLMQDPKVQKSLDHDSEYRIFHEINNAKSDEERAGIEQFAPEMHDFYKQGEIDDVANSLSWSMEGKKKTTDKRIITDTAAEEGLKYKINNPISDLQLQDEVHTVKNPAGTDLKSANDFITTKSQARDEVVSKFLQEYIDKNNIMNDTATRKMTPEELIKQGYDINYLTKNANNLKGFSPEYVNKKLALASQLNKEVSLANQRVKEAWEKVKISAEDEKILADYAKNNPSINLNDEASRRSLQNYGGAYEGKVLAAWNKKNEKITPILSEDQQISTWSQTAMPGYKYQADKDGNVTLVEDGVAVAKNTKMVNDYFKTPAATRGLKLKTLSGANDIDTVLKELGVDPSEESKVEVGTVSLTKTPSDYSEASGKTERAFVIPYTYGGKTVKVKITTDQINSPEIRALVNIPEEKANMEYETGRTYGLSKYDVYGDGKVIIDYGDKGDKSDDKFVINGTTYTGNRGMYYLANALQ